MAYTLTISSLRPSMPLPYDLSHLVRLMAQRSQVSPDVKLHYGKGLLRDNSFRNDVVLHTLTLDCLQSVHGEIVRVLAAMLRLEDAPIVRWWECVVGWLTIKTTGVLYLPAKTVTAAEAVTTACVYGCNNILCMRIHGETDALAMSSSAVHRICYTYDVHSKSDLCPWLNMITTVMNKSSQASRLVMSMTSRSTDTIVMSLGALFIVTFLDPFGDSIISLLSWQI